MSKIATLPVFVHSSQSASKFWKVVSCEAFLHAPFHSPNGSGLLTDSRSWFRLAKAPPSIPVRLGNLAGPVAQEEVDDTCNIFGRSERS